MASKIKVDQLETADGSGTIALQNQLSGMTTASLPSLTSAQMPAGSLLKSSFYDYPAYSATTSTGFTNTGSSVSYTVANTGCALYINQNFNLGKHQSNGYWAYARLLVNGQSYNEMSVAMHTQQNEYILQTFNGYITNLSLTAGDTVTFQMQIKSNNSSYSAAVDDASSYGAGLFIHEIKQ